MSQSIITSESAGADIERLNDFLKLLASGRVTNLTQILPGLLCWEGKPYTLDDHFAFESLFSTVLTKNRVYKTARQVAKSTSISANGIVKAALIPRYKLLYVTPLFDQVRRLSSNIIQPILDSSPIRGMLIDKTAQQNVLQRTFKNQSRIHFGYALLTADRLRGLQLDEVDFDEAQDIDHTLIPIIKEAMSHSNYEISSYTGTPKTLDGNLEVWWRKSSQAEWIIPCRSCGRHNIPSLEYDLIKMIGPHRDDISENKPGTVCAQCGKPISPREGRWQHRWPERMQSFLGYHVPQIIMPIHYARPDKWRALVGKMQGAGNTTTSTFANEVLGEAHDNATKLLSPRDLQRAACLTHDNTETAALKAMGGYTLRVLSADWGGGGEDGVSLTALAVLGMSPNGKVDVIFGKKLFTPHDHFAEAHETLRIYKAFKCRAFAHDYSGAGDVRQSVMVHEGLPLEKIIPIQYVLPTFNSIVSRQKGTERRPLEYYQVNKTRSLQLTCNAIKFGWVRFFNYDYKSEEEPGLLHEFLALVENKMATPGRSDIYQICKSATAPDDFAQAVNMGCVALWEMSGKYPVLTDMVTAAATRRALAARAAQEHLEGHEQFASDALGD